MYHSFPFCFFFPDSSDSFGNDECDDDYKDKRIVAVMSFLFFSFISNPYAARQSSRKHNIRPSKGRSRSYPDFGPRSHPDDCRPSTPQIVHASCCRFMGRSPEGYDDVVMEVESKELLFSDREEAEVRDERHRERQRCRPKNRHARSQSRRLGLSASVAKHTSLSLS